MTSVPFSSAGPFGGVAVPPLPVLLVEDEPSLSKTLGMALQQLGLEVWLARSLSEARSQLQKRPALVILDRMLPDGEGLEMAREIRKSGNPVLILMLTALGELSHRLEGLRSGADDYLPKPFHIEELEARVLSLLRRAPVRDHSTDEVYPLWHLDSDRLRILSPVGWRSLTPLEFKFASKLISAQGAIVTRETLLKEVWGFRFLPETRTVDFFMSRIRRKLESSPEVPAHFLTIRGAGYLFRF